MLPIEILEENAQVFLYNLGASKAYFFTQNLETLKERSINLTTEEKKLSNVKKKERLKKRG